MSSSDQNSGGVSGEGPEENPIAHQITRLAQRRARADLLHYPQPEVTRIISVANQKGGVGKTTTAVNIAASLAIAGARSWVIDFDPQGNASTALGYQPGSRRTVYEALLKGARLADLIQSSEDIPNLCFIPADIHLSGAEIELSTLEGREFRLRNVLSEHFQRGHQLPHYVIIDCPPSLGMLTLNALSATTEILIPIQCEYYALEGLGQLLYTIEVVRERFNPGLSVYNILLTLYDPRTRLSGQVVEEIRGHFPDRVLKTQIPRTVRLAEAPSFGKTVVGFDRNSLGSLAYREAAAELAERDPKPSTKREDYYG